MNCHYCQQECWELQPFQQVWRCNKCHAQYGKGHITLDTSLPGRPDKEYLVCFDYEPVLYPTRICCNGKNIILFKKLLDKEITPPNIQEKLKLYLLFS